MPRLLVQIITSLIYLQGVLKEIDKSNKKFGGKFAKLYAPFMTCNDD